MVIYPGDWEIVKAGELVKVIRGVSYKDSDVHRVKQNDNCMILRGGNILDDGINITADDNVYVNRSLIAEAQFLRKNDIVIVASTASMKVIGKSAIVDKDYRNIAPGAFLFLIRPVHDDNIFAPYVAQYFRTNFYRDNIRRLVAGGVIQNIRLEYITEMLIPLPTLKEQTAIAETLAAFDTHITNLTELITKKKAIRDGALDELMTGRTRLYGFCGDWEVKRLGECVREKLSYGINAPAIPYDRKNPAYLRITDITDDGKYSDKDKKSVITSEREKYTLRYGDIVLARTGSIGKSYLYDPKDGELVYAGYLIKAPIDCEKYDPRYIVSQLRTPRYWSWVASMSKRSVQPGINSKEYAAFTIPIPPLKEQIAIADTLSSLDKEISSLETERAKISNIRNGAINDLLTGKVRLKIGI